MIDPELLKILRCPMGKSELELQGNVLVCKQCGPRFPIKDGIPVMLIEEAELPEGCKNIDDLSCMKHNSGK